VNTTSDMPFVGQHYLNFDYVRDGNSTRKPGLLFSRSTADPAQSRAVPAESQASAAPTRDRPVGF
jgi:hypothetical protein